MSARRRLGRLFGLGRGPRRCRRTTPGSADLDVVSLAEMPEGAGGEVACIAAADNATLRKLMSMGVLPGTPVTLLQRFPAHLVQVGRIQIAVDEEIAGAIQVRLKKTAH